MMKNARQAGIGTFRHAGRVERAGPFVRIVVDVEVFGLNGLEVEAAVLHLILTEILGPAASRCGEERNRDEYQPTKPTHPALSFRTWFCPTDVPCGDDGSITPQPLELVKVPQLRMKNVYHEVHVVEQDPASLRQPFHMMRLHAAGRECRYQVLRHPAHMRVRGSRNDDEIVGRLAQTAQIQNYWIDGLSVQQRVDHLRKLSLHSDRTRPTPQFQCARRSPVRWASPGVQWPE